VTVRVVLEFENEALAKQFVKAALEDDIYASLGEWLEDATRLRTFVIGVFKKPTKYCDPGDGHRGKKTSGGWTRGKKYGWWVCGICGKPTERWANGSLWPYSLGFNLLPERVAKWARGPKTGVAEWTEEECGLEPNQVLDGGLSREH
jgi:hypothetical protein